MKQRREITAARITAARAVALLCAVLLLSGCAVLFRGTTQFVPVDSAPAGAEVFVNGELVGLTPLEVELGRSGEHEIMLRWNGQERSFTLHPQLDGEGGALLLADAAPGGVLIGLSAVELASCGRRGSPSGGGGWAPGFSGLCRDLSLAGLGVGAVLVAIPVVVDVATGGVMQLSPSEIFVAFD